MTKESILFAAAAALGLGAGFSVPRIFDTDFSAAQLALSASVETPRNPDPLSLQQLRPYREVVCWITGSRAGEPLSGRCSR